MVIFHSYVSLPEGTWVYNNTTIKKNIYHFDHHTVGKRNKFDAIPVRGILMLKVKIW